MTDYTLGQACTTFLRSKRGSLAESSYVEYKRVIDFMLVDLGDGLLVSELNPPVGTDVVENFLYDRWDHAPHSFNRNLSIVRQLVKFLVGRGHLDRDPILLTERKHADKHPRSTFDEKTVRKILASADNARDRIALRLLLIYALRKGALTNLQMMGFDHDRKMVSFMTKGRKYHAIPIAGEDLWQDVAIVERELSPMDFLLHRPGHPDRALSPHSVHLWWYERLTAAGIVEEGTTRGQRMHKARHTAGQRLLDSTGNLKATQVLLGHASVQTTGDVYAGWDSEQLRTQMEDIDIKNETE